MCSGIVHGVSDITYTCIIYDVSSMGILEQVLPFQNMYSIVQNSVFNVSYNIHEKLDGLTEMSLKVVPNV